MAWKPIVTTGPGGAKYSATGQSGVHLSLMGRRRRSPLISGKRISLDVNAHVACLSNADLRKSVEAAISVMDIAPANYSSWPKAVQVAVAEGLRNLISRIKGHKGSKIRTRGIVACIISLATMGRSEAAREIEPLVLDHDHFVQTEAIKALARMGFSETENVRAVWRALAPKIGSQKIDRSDFTAAEAALSWFEVAGNNGDIALLSNFKPSGKGLLKNHAGAIAGILGRVTGDKRAERLSALKFIIQKKLGADYLSEPEVVGHLGRYFPDFVSAMAPTRRAKDVTRALRIVHMQLGR